ncbi:formin-like protein 3, partial [Tubulanus polymorphus]|uniref:formin-like protein 3 n=1 Tax=Tubulanus polymorphus TaxID=672921 RepID=UPI003DA60CE2
FYVHEQFREYMEMLSPLSEDEERELRMLSVEEKWKIIFNLQIRAPILPLDFYLEQIRKYLASCTERPRSKSLSRAWGAHSKEKDNSLGSLLKKLKLDIKMSYDSFVRDFLNETNNGVDLLISVLKEIQKEQLNKHNGNKKSKHEIQKKNLTEEYDCLLCLKFASRMKEMTYSLVKSQNGCEIISHCLMSSYSRTRIVALELLTLCCDIPSGYPRVMEAMSYCRLKFGESVRFKFLVGMLLSQGPTFIHFQGACMKFLNKMINCEDNMNARVYIQYELELAGLDVDSLEKHSKKGEGIEFDELQKELVVWRENYLNVQNIQSNLNSVEGRNIILRQEVDLLQQKLKTSEKEKTTVKKQLSEMTDRCDEYRDRAASLQDAVENLTQLYKERTGKEAQKDVTALEEVMKPLEQPPTSETLTVESRRNSASSLYSIEHALVAGEPPPVAPPAPPPMLPRRMPSKSPLPAVNLPLLNWTAMNDVKNTVFTKIEDEERIYDELDFRELDRLFEMKIRKEGKASRDRRERALKRLQQQVKFIEIARARNMVITKRRIGHTSRMIRDFIDKLNLENLPGEYAELLIKFIPAKDELRMLAQHAKDYSNMAEAEQFMFQLAQVERLEPKLSVMAYMSVFDDLINCLAPQIESVTKASESILKCKKLQKIFEIILAYGNYMNSMKRGYASGFKLDTLYKLSDIKSSDRSKTLLHFLVGTVEKKYPELLDFYEEIHLNVKKGASIQAILSDVHSLRTGFSLVKSEREKQDEISQQLDDFFEYASVHVPKIADSSRHMEEVYKEVCVAYGETNKSIEPDAFFAIFADFIRSFQCALWENNHEGEARPHSDGSQMSHHVTLTRHGSGLADFAKSVADKAIARHRAESDNQNEPTKRNSNKDITVGYVTEVEYTNKNLFTTYLPRGFNDDMSSQCDHSTDSNWCLKGLKQESALVVDSDVDSGKHSMSHLASDSESECNIDFSKDTFNRAFQSLEKAIYDIPDSPKPSNFIQSRPNVYTVTKAITHF